MDACRPLLAAALAAATTAFAADPQAAGVETAGRAVSRAPAVASADLVLAAGASKTILSVPRVGRWSASCTRDHRVAISFVAGRLLPTADVVVARSSGAPLARRVNPGHRVAPEDALDVVSQHWQIAPFAAAQVRVTSADVVGRGLQERGSATACAASVVAVTGPDQGPTREG
jgi:hypothetical protein